MRVLFASLASVGHTYPLVPLAVAVRDAGHEVHFAAGEHVHPDLAAHGLRPFRPADSFYELYAEDLAPELDRLRPDLVIHGWGVPGAATAAADAGIPSLWHGFGRAVPPGIGLTVPPVDGAPHLDICPPSLQDEHFLATATRMALRPVPYSPPTTPGTVAGGGVAARVGSGSEPLAYLTLGTAFGTAELLTTAIEGLALVDARVVVAAGRVSPEDLGPLPNGVTVLPWVDQADLLGRVDLVVHHGGSGTTLGALAAGLPQLVLPQGADQFANADALCAAGAALRLLPPELGVAAIARHANTLLPRPAGSGYRDAARAMAEEIARMPGPAEVARALPGFL